jgi:glycine/D-amino acid oxidase-like deaminating enzyme
MEHFDWIVVGGGITGAALSYELTRQGLSVLLLERHHSPENATRYSYGGLAYWSGTDPQTRQLSQEGIELHRQLSAELGQATEFRELDLLLTIDVDANPQQIVQNYTQFAIAPQLLDPEQAWEIEPLLNRDRIAGALRLPHAHIHPSKTTQAYLQAMQRLGGRLQIEAVTDLLCSGSRVEGVKTPKNTYRAGNTVMCAGGLTHSLLADFGITVPVYFTHAEVFETPPLPLNLRTLIMPAELQRFDLETQATQPEVKPLWNEPGHEPAPPVLDPGAIQFQDGHLIIGQWSRILTDPDAGVDAVASETALRQQIGQVLPSLQDVPGTWRSCLVAFSAGTFSTIGPVEYWTGLHLFSGFTSTLLFAPPLARRFATWAAGKATEIFPNG